MAAPSRASIRTAVDLDRARGGLEIAMTSFAKCIFDGFADLQRGAQYACVGGRSSFEIKAVHPHDVATIIDRSGIAVRAGTHCVMPLLSRFEVSATCRASFGLYNTREELDGLAQALIKAQGFFA
jgi:hypothetical protein